MGISPDAGGRAGLSRRRRWARGCGLGCGLLVALGVLALLALGVILRRTFQGIEDARASYEALVAESGPVEDYVPPPDGVPSRERWEVFLQVRDDTAAARATLQATVARLWAPSPPPGGLPGTVRVAFDILARLIDQAAAYLAARDRALLARGMGPGEYVYLYGLAYYSALGHRPGDAIARPGRGPAGDEGGVDPDVFGEDDAMFGPAAVRRRYRRYTLAMLGSHLASVDPSDRDQRAALEREIHQMEVDPGRILWQDGLPSAISASVAPIRERLEARYDPITNRLELPLAAHEMR